MSSTDLHLRLSLTPEKAASYRFSHIKRKAPPTETASFRYPTADPTDPLAPIWALRNKVLIGPEGTPDDDVRPRPSASDDDIHEIWGTLGISDSDSEEPKPQREVTKGRARAQTLPSKQFATLVRVPPPAVDVDLLTTSRSSGSLRPTSMRARSTYVPPPIWAAGPPPPTDSVSPGKVQSLKEKKLSRSFSFIAKRKSATPNPPRKISLASISAPALVHPQASAASIASNMSLISLSAFPLPPAGRPVPPVPSLPSYILQVDPVQPADDEPQRPVAESPDISSPRRPSYILEVDPLPFTRAGSSSFSIRRDAQKALQSSDESLPPIKPSTAEATSSDDGVQSSHEASDSSHSLEFKKDDPQGRASPTKDARSVEPPESDDDFDETRLPTVEQLEEAAMIPVTSESGVRIPFGQLWYNQRTIVCFIRHFWCPLCQDYMFSISRNVSPQVLLDANIDLVIVSNGSYEMIKSYRRIFRTPFALYTDPTHQLYNALGMTLQTLEKGPRGSYVRHGMIGGIGMVVANAVKVGMPVWKQGGDISQLGGEFILGPGMTCSWVHRMRYTRSHVPILHVIEAAGVDMYTPLNRALSSTGGSFLGISSDEETKWMERRRKVLSKLKGRKMSRRGGKQWLETTSTSTSTASKRSSGISSVTASSGTGSLCAWDPNVEQAINVGFTQLDRAIIEEAEEEEVVEARESVVELEQGQSSLEEPADVPAPVDVESELDPEYTESLVSRDDFSLARSESATDVSTLDTQSQSGAVEVHFDKMIDQMISLDKPQYNRHWSVTSTASSVGSAYEVVVNHHRTLFGGRKKIETLASMSESSLGSF